MTSGGVAEMNRFFFSGECCADRQQKSMCRKYEQDRSLVFAYFQQGLLCRLYGKFRRENLSVKLAAERAL